MSRFFRGVLRRPATSALMLASALVLPSGAASHGGDNSLFHVCVRQGDGEVRRVGPNNNCSGMPGGTWLPVHWPLEGVRQVEVESDGMGLKMEETLRSVVAVRPEVIVLSSVPDRGSALLAAQLSSSILVIAVLAAQNSAQAVAAFLNFGVPPHLVAGSLAAVTCQRLVRQICRICKVPADPPAPQTLAHNGISAEEAARLQ